MYPLKFQNIYFEKIWGGRDFELFRDNLPKGSIGESWDVACHPHGTSIIDNGEYKGMKLDELLKLKGKELLGNKVNGEKFPLLVKLINSKDKLSVQVHPNDEYAEKTEGESGKTEVWYVVEAFEGANLVVGTKECTKEEFAEAMRNGELNKVLNKVEVKKGDVFFIESGLVHAIGEGVIIAEIQENSDTTYRVFDYNRGRELHVDKALQVIDLNLKGEKSKGAVIEENINYRKIHFCSCQYFVLDMLDILFQYTEKVNKNRFTILTCVEGEGEIFWQNGKEKVLIGDSILIPASLENYDLVGEMKVLVSYLPN